LSADKKTVGRVKLAELETRAESEEPIWNGSLDVIKDVQVKLQVSLGEAEMSVAELLELREQSIIALNRDASHQVDLLLDGKVVGRGNLVVVGENFGIELTEIKNS
jgi:flagellar motor switch protein FliN/FliY